MGSTPAKGSSSIMNLVQLPDSGISVRRRSPPDNRSLPIFLQGHVPVKFSNRCFKFSFDLLAEFGRFQNGADIILHSHFTEKQKLPEPGIRCLFGRGEKQVIWWFLLVQKNLARVGCNQSGSHGERSGFSRTVRDRVIPRFALLHLDRHIIIHNGSFTVFLKRCSMRVPWRSFPERLLW